jgi:ribonuclease HI
VAGILFITPEGHTIPKSYQLMFSCTNNIAKYKALIRRIKITLECQITELEVYGDSQLVINQINDDYQTKDDNLLPYKIMVDVFKNYFVAINFSKISIIDNKVVDAMATIASLLQLLENKK